MVSAISAIDGTSGDAVQRIIELTNTASARAKAAQKMVDEMDSDGDGAVSKDEFVQASTARQATDANSGTTGVLPSPEEIFRKIDANGDQAVTTDELASGLAQAGAGSGEAKGTGGPQGAGGPPKGGGGPKGAGGAQGGTVTTTTTTEEDEESDSATADPADTNGDGVVSIKEKLAYELKQQLEGVTGTDRSADGKLAGKQAEAEQEI